MATHYEPGKYQAAILEHGFGESERKQTPFIWFLVQPEHGAYTREVRLYLSAKTVDRVLSILRDSLGWKGANFSDLEEISFEGDLVNLECKHGPGTDSDGQETMFERWDFERPGGAALRSNPEVGLKLDALFAVELAKGKE